MLDFEEHRKKQKEQRATQTLIDNYYKNNVKPKAKKTTTTSSKKKKQNDDGFFKKSNGGFWSTLGASTLDAGGNLVEGSLNAFEGISDWTRYRGADVLDFFGADKKANEIRKIADEDTTSGIVSDWNHITAGDLAGKKSEEEIGHFKSVEENSIFGNKADSVFQGVGNSLTGAAVGSYLGAPVASQKVKNVIGMTSFGVSATGGAEEEAIAAGATRDEARLYGALSGAIEAGSEMAFGGLGKISQSLGVSKGALDDVIVNNFTRNIKNSLLRNIATLGIKSVGEGLEEVVAGFGNAWAQNLTYMKEKDFWDLVKDQKLLDSFVSGMLSSAIMQSPSTVRYSVQDRDVNTGLTSTQRKYVNEIAQQRMVEAQRRNAKLNGYEKGKIEQRAVTDFQQGRLIDTSKLPLRTQQAVNLPGLNAQTGAVTQSSVKGMDLQQSAYYYGFNPNSEVIVSAKTMLDNRGIKSRFDADAFKNISGNAYWTNNNGVREVVFNPNASEQAILEEIAMHELTHDLMSSENSKATLDKQNIIDYVSTLDGYKESRAKLEKLYSNQTKGMSKQKANALINEEIIADTLGKNIGSQEYIRRLIDDEPSIAKNIYDWVVNKVANKSGVKNEKAYWNNVKNNFEKAYNMEWVGKKNKSDTRHSFMSEKGLENAIKTDARNQVLADKLVKAKELRKKGLTNEEIRQRTLWFQDPNGKWLFEIADSEVEINKLEKNKTYKLEEVLPHNDLFEAYPELRKMIIKTKDIKKGKNGETFVGQYDTVLDQIFINNELIGTDTEGIRNTILHEVQHKIQEIEGLESGNESKNPIRYYTSLGEIQSADVEMRSRLDYSDIKKKAPEVSKEFPIHQHLREIHENINKKSTQKYLQENPKVAELYNEIYNNGNEGEYERAKINKKGTTNNISKKDEILHKIREWLRVEGNYKSLQRELDNSSFSMSEQLENQASNLVEEDIQTTNAMLDNFKSYLEEYDITNPTQEDIDNSLIDLLSYDNDMTPAETLKYEKQYKEVVNEYLKEQNQNVRYSLTDNQGRELTKEQQEFFKDSKVRDENGNLLTMYHGTNNEFTIFEKNKIGSNTRNQGLFGKGFYFTNNKSLADSYNWKDGKLATDGSGTTMEVYLNLKNPFNWNSIRTKEQLEQFVEDTNMPADIAKWNKGYTPYAIHALTEIGQPEAFTNTLIKNGYDGVIFDYGEGTKEIVAFDSNQIKNVDNTNPTEDADIRYSLSDNQEERISKLQKEYESWDKARDVVFDERDALRKELNELIRSENYKTANSKFMEMIKSGLSPDEISKTPEYQLMAEEEKIRKKLKEYDEDIKVMTEDMTRITEMIENEEKSHRNPKDAIKQAKDFFGTTNDFREAGYLLQDGTLLDFSGRTQGSNTYGRRTLDHREINEVGYDMDEFIELGNIRMKPESSGFELSKPLTKEQKSIIRDYLDTLDDDIMIDIAKDGKVLYDSATYKKGTSASKIFNDLEYYFENGSFPKQSQFAEFRYSLSKQNEGWQSFLDKNFEAKGTKTRLSDIKLPGLTNAVQQEVQKPSVPKVDKPVKNKNLPLRKEESVLKLDANQIADALNGNTKDKIQVPGGKKLRRWSETSTKSDVLKDIIGINDLDINKITYVPISNQKTLERADAQLSNMSYEDGISYIKGQLTTGKASLTDIAIAEKLIVEARNIQDTTMVADLLMDVSILGTELGQKVQALSIIQKMTPEGQLKMYQKILTRAKSKGTKGFENVEITPDMVKTILDAYDANGNYNQDDLNNRVEVFKQQIAEQMTSTIGEKADEWRYLSMLGNPKTHIRNVVSNVAMKGTLSVKNAVARTLEMALPQAKRTKTWKAASSYIQGFAEQTAEEWKGIISGDAKYTETQQLNKMKKTFKSETLNKLSNANSKLLEMEDWLFSKSAFKNSLQEYLTAQGIKTEQDIADNPEIVEKAKMHALEQAQIATFRQYSWLANKINEIENKNKATKVLVGAVMPFKKTPINVAKAGINYSPLGLIKTMSYDLVQVKNGNMEASQFIDNLAQGLTGTSLTLLGYALAQAGFITGGGDDDKEGKYDYALGNQTYALKIGNNTYSISWLSPVAMPLLVGANAFSELEEKEEWDVNVLMNTLASTLDPISEMSFISSLTDVLQSYQQGSMQMISNMGQSAFSSYVTQYFPTLFSQVASVFDDKKRSTRASGDSKFKYGEELFNQIRYKIPGLRNTLPVATDIWGNEQKQAENIVQRAFETFIAPYNRKSVSNTALDKELKRLYNETGETSVIPGTPSSYIKYKDERYDMNNKEYVSYKKTYGTKANEYLNSLIETNAYKNATDEEKAKMVQEIYGYAGAYAKKDFFSKRKVDYTSDEIKAINKFEELKMNSNDIGEFVAINKLSSTIKNDKDLDASEKRAKIGEYMLNANLKDNQLAYLYSKYYSSEEELNNILTLRIPMKEFIKFDLADIEGKYNAKTGKTINGSKKNATIEFVNTLNLTKAQRAILVKSVYSTYKANDNDIIRYVNTLPGTANEKKVLLKSIGFDNYDKDVVNYILSQNISSKEKLTKLKDLGFTIRDGRVYY